MKKYYLLSAIAIIVHANSYSQTSNLFPSSGNVGVGTNLPAEKFQVVGRTNLCGNVIIDSSATIKQSLKVEKNLTIQGSTIFNGSANVTGDFKIGGNFTKAIAL